MVSDGSLYSIFRNCKITKVRIILRRHRAKGGIIVRLFIVVCPTRNISRTERHELVSNFRETVNFVRAVEDIQTTKRATLLCLYTVG